MLAEAGTSARWSYGPGFTASDAVLVFPPLAPVTVCVPATDAVQVVPVQDPFGAIEKVVVAVTSPRELSYWSRASAVYVCEAPAAIVAVAGVIVMWSTPPLVTSREAVPVLPASVPVTVCVPVT